MAIANSVTFGTDKDTLFSAVIQIVNDAGYIISETDDAARKIVYYADLKRALTPQQRFEITISVSGRGQNQKQENSSQPPATAMLNIRIVGLEYQLWNDILIANDKKFENELITFIIGELQKEYVVVVSEKQITNAPGTGTGGGKGGCLVVLAYLGLLAAGGGFGCYTLLMSLWP